MKNSILNRVYTYILLGLIVWGMFLRLYRFGSIPTGLNRDEAALGYNAYTIAFYGVDEWNQPWPLLFKSFGDYKLPGYIYGLAPLIRTFGVQDWVIRLPSLVAGIGLIYLAYRLVYFLTKDRLRGMLAAAFTALNPWAIFYSRTAFEAHVALFWLVLTLFILIQKYRWWKHVMLLATCLLSILTYNTPLLLLPLLVVFIWFLPEKTKRQKLGLMITIVLVGLMGWLVLAPVTSQKQGITIFSDPTIAASINQHYSQAQGGLGRMLASKYATWVGLMVHNLIQSVGPVFLVTRGGSHPWHGILGYGHLLWAVYVLGLGSLWFIKAARKGFRKYVFLCLMVGTLLPAVVTVDAPHATRSLLYLYLFGLLASLVWQSLGRWRMAVIIILLAESLLYAKAYFLVSPQVLPRPYPSGLKEAIMQAFETLGANQELVIANTPNALGDVLGDQVYIWVLLYSNADPRAYHQTRQLLGADVSGMVRIGGFDRFTMTNSREPIPPEALVIERDDNGVYRLVN